MRLLLSIASWGYLVFVVGLWLTMYFGGDQWWPATLVLFGPRWIAALPLVILLPLTAWKNRRLIFPLLAGAIVVFGPLMGFCLSIWQNHPNKNDVFRVLTCNIHNGSYSAQKLSSLIHDSRADIVTMQECPQNPGLAIPTGWHVVREGELAMLSRYPLKSVSSLQTFHPPHKWPRTSLLHCVVKAPGGDLIFFAVHLPSPRYGLQAVLDRNTLLSPSRRGLLVSETAHRLRASHELSRALSAVKGSLIIAGDFNMPVDSVIYRGAWNDYTNAFSEAGFGYGWTVRGGLRGISSGVRIDHVLVGEGLRVLLSEAGPDVGSDHLPLIADIVRSDSRE